MATAYDFVDLNAVSFKVEAIDDGAADDRWGQEFTAGVEEASRLIEDLTGVPYASVLADLAIEDSFEWEDPETPGRTVTAHREGVLVGGAS